MTTPEPIEQACEVFEQKLEAFEKLMKHKIVYSFSMCLICDISDGNVV